MTSDKPPLPRLKAFGASIIVLLIVYLLQLIASKVLMGGNSLLLNFVSLRL